MNALKLDEAAFSKPGGELPRLKKRANPVDLAFLSEQVMHDVALEAEVLSLFSAQLLSMLSQLNSAQVHERQILAHTLSGSAKGVGAYNLAEYAEALEAMPHNLALIAPLEAECVRTVDFIAGLQR